MVSTAGKQKLSARQMTVIAMLVAMQVIFQRFLAINIVPDVLRVTFGFLPIALAGLLMGPVTGAIVGAVGDIIGAVAFPSGPYFPGFTVTAALTGAIYGLFLHKSAPSHGRAALAQALVSVICNVLLNTLWLNLMYGKAFLGLLPTRLVKNALEYPVDLLLIVAVLRYKPTLERLL